MNPMLAANRTPKYPRPPNPSTATVSPPLAPLFRSALKVVTPAHINGAPSTEESSLGTSANASVGATMYSAYPPSKEIPVVSNDTVHAKNSPRRQCSQYPQFPPCQPIPTRCPFFHGFTPSPTASTTPITSCPGTRGY